VYTRPYAVVVTEVTVVTPVAADAAVAVGADPANSPDT
jgi:hypothetical protein